MKRKICLLFLFAGIIVSLASCTQGSCFEKTDSLLDASFYSFTTGKVAAPDSLTVFGLGFDTSKIYSATKGIRSAGLPLNSVTENSVFVLKINSLTDTLSVSYTSYPHLISKECGYTYYHEISTVVHSRNTIDSVWIIKRTVTNQDEENIRIYY